eukprot:717358_1
MSAGDGFEYSCDYCRVPFDCDIHIQCAECRDIRLCLTCFSYGKQLPPHKNNHDYYIVEYITKSIFKSNSKNETKWTGHQDILLLDGIEKYGLGNWKQIAEHIGHNKTPKQTELHYLQTYCTQPHHTEEEDNDDEEENIIDLLNDERKTEPKSNKKKSIAHSKDKINLNGYTNPTSYIAGTRPIHRFVNYYPYRHEFDSEYRELAELLVSDLTRTDLENTSVDMMNNIRQYDAILTIRNNIKNFILDRKLMLFYDKTTKNRTSRKQNNDLINNKPQIRKELLEKLQPFCKYFASTEQYLKFLETNVIIKFQRYRIDQYIEYRKSGCRTMEDINLRRRVQTESNNRYCNRTYNKRRSNSNHRKRKRNLIVDDSDSENEMTQFGSNDTPTFGKKESTNTNKKRKLMMGLNKKFTQRMKTTNNNDYGSEGIESQPSYLLLSLPERDFVAYLKILPTQYMQYKNVFINENIKNGYVQKKQMKKYFPHFSDQRINDFCNFFARLKWIQVVP